METRNSVILDGNLGRDAVGYPTKSGGKIVRDSIAISEEYNGVKTTIWVNLLFVGKCAIEAESLKKGQHVRVLGKLSENQEQVGKDGKVYPKALFITVFSFEVIASNKPQSANVATLTPQESKTPINDGNFFADDCMF